MLLGWRSGLEYRVNLAAVLEPLPGAGKSRGNDERIATCEYAALAAIALDHHPARCHDTQLVLRVAHTPLAARRRPTSGEELLSCISEEVGDSRNRLAADEPVGRQHGFLCLDRSVEDDDCGVHGNIVAEIAAESHGIEHQLNPVGCVQLIRYVPPLGTRPVLSAR